MNEWVSEQMNEVTMAEKFMLIENFPWKIYNILYKSLHMTTEIANGNRVREQGILIGQDDRVSVRCRA